MQDKKLTITFKDDEIALEDDQILRFFLSNPNGTNLTEPSTIDIEVADDDSMLKYIYTLSKILILFFTLSCDCFICLFILQLH